MLNSSKQCAQLPGSRSMKADFYTSDESLMVLLDMPGVPQDGVNVTYQDGRLVIEGTGLQGDQRTYRRAFRVSEKYEVNRTIATVDHGVVRLEIPKHADAKAVRIPVNTA